MKFNQKIELRVSTALDAEFAFKTIKETMREYAIATWVNGMKEILGNQHLKIQH